MLAGWTKILPFFVVEWMAKRYCERIPFKDYGTTTNPYPGTVITWKDD